MRTEPAAPPAARPRPALPRGPALALAVTGLSVVLCVALEPLLDPHNLLLVYTSGVVFVAARAGRLPALLATAGAILSFDLIHVEPRWSIKPTDPQYYFTFLLMAAFGWLVGELSTRLRAEVVERALHEQRSAQARMESEAERLRSTLLASISHDFRTPLTTIVGSTSSLLQQWDALDEPRRLALLQGVLAESRRLHQLSSNLLELTRLERGMVRPSCEWCLADELVNEALASVGARLERHRVRSRVAPDLPVWCDPRLVEQALVNLLENAARHTPPGTGVTIDAQAGEGEWTLVVADDGPGFAHGADAPPPGAEAGASFERSGAVSSRGLGLAICAAIAKLHGGRIETGSERGARIALVLPLPALPAELLGEGAP